MYGPVLTPYTPSDTLTDTSLRSSRQWAGLPRPSSDNGSLWVGGKRLKRSSQTTSRTAMVGHKTESIYRRYAIVDDAMLKEGACAV